MYWEDADFSRFVISSGYKCLVASKAIIYHSVAASSGGWGNPRGFYYLTRNRVKMANKWLPFHIKILFHLFYIISRPILALYRAANGNKKAAQAIIVGFIDGYRGVSGRWANHDL
jgi:GT2 family glycosyltransferase